MRLKVDPAKCIGSATDGAANTQGTLGRQADNRELVAVFFEFFQF